MLYLKRKHFLHRIQFYTEKVWFVWRKIEKNQIFFFYVWKSMLTCSLQLQIPHICAKRFENWVHLCFGKVLKLKVNKRELIISDHLEMVDGYLQWWLLQPPPSLIRVNKNLVLPRLNKFQHFCNFMNIWGSYVLLNL